MKFILELKNFTNKSYIMALIKDLFKSDSFGNSRSLEMKFVTQLITVIKPIHDRVDDNPYKLLFLGIKDP